VNYDRSAGGELQLFIIQFSKFISGSAGLGRGGSFPKLTATYSPPLKASLPQPLEEHGARLLRDNSSLLYPSDTLNSSSWFLSQPKDDMLIFKAVQTLLIQNELFQSLGNLSIAILTVKPFYKFFLFFLI
jgi:hypothetical protein